MRLKKLLNLIKTKKMYYYEDNNRKDIILIFNYEDYIVASVKTENFENYKDALNFASFMVRSMNFNLNDSKFKNEKTI